MEKPDNESEIQQAIQIEGPHHKCQLMRNNSGAFKDAQGRFVWFGLGNISKKHSEQIKSSDLIGFTQVVITPAMVGKTVAVFTAVEVKRPGFKPDKRFNAQIAFLTWVSKSGGIAFWSFSVEGFRENLSRWFWDLGV